MKFYTSYAPAPRKMHPKCPFEKQDFIENTSTCELEPAGTIPFYKEIQSYHDSTRLDFKIKRFALGDNTAFDATRGFYGDFSNAPSDLRQILDTRKKLNKDFEQLPDDVRTLFDNDFTKFEESVKDGTAERIFSDYFRSVGNSGKTSSGAGGGSSPGTSSEGLSNS